MSEPTGQTVIQALFRGEPLDRSSARTLNDRVVVSGLSLAGAIGAEPLAQLHHAEISAVHFDGCDFGRLRFFSCQLLNCTFQRCKFDNFRMWETILSRCELTDCDLRGASMGGIGESGRRNACRDVHFVRSNFQHLGFANCEFLRCLFFDCKLRHVNFDGSSFQDCVFKGVLKDVSFNQRSIPGIPLNEMQNVDFREAQLRDVEFRRLNLFGVRLPSDEEHLIMSRDDMLFAITELSQSRKQSDKGLAEFLKGTLPWTVPDGPTFVAHKEDLKDSCGEATLTELVRLLRLRRN